VGSTNKDLGMGLYDRLELKPSGAQFNPFFPHNIIFITTLPTYLPIILILPFNMSAQLRQSTLSFHQSRRIEANRPGPKPKALTTLASAASNTLVFRQKRRRAVRGVNERQAIEAFKSSCNHQAAGEPDSNDSKLYDFDGDHRP